MAQFDQSKQSSYVKKFVKSLKEMKDAFPLPSQNVLVTDSMPPIKDHYTDDELSKIMFGHNCRSDMTFEVQLMIRRCYIHILTLISINTYIMLYINIIS